MSEETADSNLDHIFGRLEAVERRVRQAVQKRRANDPEPDDAFRGLYLSDAAVDAILASKRQPYQWVPDITAVEEAADEAERAGHPSRLRRLAQDAHLSHLDIDLLLVALAPELDSRFEPLYGYLNDDVTRRRPSVGLALRLCGRRESDPCARSRLMESAILVRTGLITIEVADRSWLTRAIRVPERVGAHVLGDDGFTATVTGVIDPAGSTRVHRGRDVLQSWGFALGQRIVAGSRLAYIRQTLGGPAVDVATQALDVAGYGLLAVDASRMVRESDQLAIVREIILEALLRHAGIVIGPMEALSEANPTVIRVLADGAGVIPVTLYGTTGWDPRWCAQMPIQIMVEPISPTDRVTVWRDALRECLSVPDSQESVDQTDLPEDLDINSATSHFRLTAGQIYQAAQVSVAQARLAGTSLSAHDLRQGARCVNAGGLERLARRIEPTVSFCDLVLPDSVVSHVREVCSRARLRDLVLGQWRMRSGGGRGRGVTGLFAGDSGTGKTMSAEVVAGELGLDLYVVNLATVVDKYIGETEKNLERIFTEAAGINGVLLFDEADAIFGRRSEVRDAHDRYANIESAYLLQRMETFDGLAILATNLRANLDDAFIRRLDMIIDFPMPDESQRRILWDRCLGDQVVRADDIDLDFCAKAFELSGGNIRSATITAAYLAAERDCRVSMVDLIRAIAREYRKLGRLVLEREFGPYLEISRMA